MNTNTKLFQESFQKLANKYKSLRVCSVTVTADSEIGADFDLTGSQDVVNYVDFCIKSVNLPNPVSKIVLRAILDAEKESPGILEQLKNFINEIEVKALAEVPIEEKEDWDRLFPQMKRAIDQLLNGKEFQIPPVIALTLFTFVQMAGDFGYDPADADSIFTKMRKKS